MPNKFVFAQNYDWDDSIKGLILSSFFWGYSITQIPASQAALYIGPKTLFVAGGIGSGLLTIATPWIASISWKLLLINRMLMGAFQGAMFPCTHMMLAKWAHPMERTRMASITYSGTQAGVVLMFGISGVIASSPLGWQGIFYCSGALALVWAVLVLIYLKNTPAECTNISANERAYLESMMPATSSNSNGSIVVPWKEMLTSKPVIALIIVHSTQNWGYYTLLTMIPTYMREVLGFDIKTVSV